MFGEDPVTNKTWIDSITATVVFLSSEFPQIIDGKQVQNKTVFGSGLFVLHEGRVFLVTATHVAKDMNPNGHITYKGDDGVGIVQTFSQLSGAQIPVWITHPNADVSVLELHPDAEQTQKLQGHFLESSFRMLKSMDHISRERPTMTFGFPLQLGSRGRFSAISREAKPSSDVISIREQGTSVDTSYLFLDSPSIGGFSGGPVLHYPGPYTENGALVMGNDVMCIGIIHGTISDETGGKLAAVVPSTFILEALNMAIKGK